jgi:hypothetical protein
LKLPQAPPVGSLEGDKLNTKPLRTMLLGLMIMLIGVALVPVSSGSAIVIPFAFLAFGMLLGLRGYTQEEKKSE